VYSFSERVITIQDVSQTKDGLLADIFRLVGLGEDDSGEYMVTGAIVKRFGDQRAGEERGENMRMVGPLLGD